MKMLVNRATGLMREPSDTTIAYQRFDNRTIAYNKSRVRYGKTAKDHANGNPARRRQRQEARAAWQQDKGKTNDSFPV